MGLKATLQARGAKVVAVQLEGLDATRIAQLITIGAEIGNAQSHALERYRSEFACDVRVLLAAIARFSAQDYVQAQRQRHRIFREFLRVFEGVDVIVTPTNACTAPRVPMDALRTGESNLELLSKVMRFVVPANMTGMPAISLPAGYDRDGLPVGFQVMGRPWEEHVLLRVAAAAERDLERQAPKRHWRPVE